MEKIKKTLILIVLAIFALTTLLPALLSHKQKEWEETGMSSVFEALNPDQNQEEQSDSTDDEL